MVSNDSYIKPLSPEDLLLFKEVKPLARNELEALRELAILNVKGFSEQEVCACIINPIVRILGYRKGAPVWLQDVFLASSAVG